jgi:hypothetical protein
MNIGDEHCRQTLNHGQQGSPPPLYVGRMRLLRAEEHRTSGCTGVWYGNGSCKPRKGGQLLEH